MLQVRTSLRESCVKRLQYFLACLGVALLSACGGEGDDVSAALTVDLSADRVTGIAPLSVNFSAAVPGGGDEVGYTWTFGNGDAAQGSASRSYTFTEAGTFEVAVEANAGTQKASDTVTVTVAAAPVAPDNGAPAVALEASTTTGQAPLTVEFSANALDPDGDGLRYSWNFGDGTALATGGAATQAHTFTETGSYAAIVTVDDGKGGVARAELQIAVADPETEVPPTEPPGPPDDSEPNEPPTVTLSANTARGSAPLTVSFSAEASDPEGEPLTYAWIFGNGGTAEGNSSRTVTYREPGEYTVVVAVSDGIAEERASFEVTVTEPAEPPPSNTPPVVSVTASPVRGRAPLSVELRAEASDADGDELTYLWDFGDGGISSDNPVTHTYEDVGDYSATVTVSDRRGGKTRAEVAIEAAPGAGEPTEPDVPFYGEWAWAARSASGEFFEGYLSVSRRTPEPGPEFADTHVEGGMGAWTYCEDGVDACGAPTGLGYIDIVDYGQGEQFDIIFVDGATGLTTLVAFDEDDRLGSEVDGAPTLQGGGAWIYEDGSSDDLSFAIVKIDSEPATAMSTAMSTLSAQRNRSR